MEWLKARLKEKSTWVGIAALVLSLLTSFGVTLPEGVSDSVKAIIENIGLVVGGLLVGSSTSE